MLACIKAQGTCSDIDDPLHLYRAYKNLRRSKWLNQPNRFAYNRSAPQTEIRAAEYRFRHMEERVRDLKQRVDAVENAEKEHEVSTMRSEEEVHSRLQEQGAHQKEARAARHVQSTTATAALNEMLRGRRYRSTCPAP